MFSWGSHGFQKKSFISCPNYDLEDFDNSILLLDLDSIGSSLGIALELIWSGVEWSGPAIRPGLDNRHLIKEDHRGLRR